MDKQQKLECFLKTACPVERARLLRNCIPAFYQWYKDPRGLCIVVSDEISNFTSPDDAFCLIVSTEQALRDLECAYNSMPFPRFIAYVPRRLVDTDAYRQVYGYARLVVDVQLDKNMEVKEFGEVE